MRRAGFWSSTPSQARKKPHRRPATRQNGGPWAFERQVPRTPSSFRVCAYAQPLQPAQALPDPKPNPIEAADLPLHALPRQRCGCSPPPAAIMAGQRPPPNRPSPGWRCGLLPGGRPLGAAVRAQFRPSLRLRPYRSRICRQLHAITSRRPWVRVPVLSNRNGLAGGRLSRRIAPPRKAQGRASRQARSHG